MEAEDMKIYVCLVMALLFVPLCTADIFFPSITAGIDYALVAASVADSNYAGPAVIALSECDCPGIFFGGLGSGDDLIILNSGMHINSIYNPGGATGAFDQTSNLDPDIVANYINVVGGIDDLFDWPEDIYVHDYTYDIIPVPDPYAYLPDNSDDYIGFPDKGTITDTNEPATYSPGYYSGGIQISFSLINLLPGDYYLDSVGQSACMSVSGGVIVGEGITLHIVGDADIGIEIQGNANIDISAPTSGVYEGVAIYQKRDPTYECTKSCVDWPNSYPLSEFNGTGDIIIDGAVYMPHNKLILGGTGYIYLRRVIADRFYVYGTAEKIIGYDGSDYIPGDLSKNGIVDIDDLVLFCAQAQWELDHWLEDIYIESNLNYDMNLDLQDFAIFSNHWLADTIESPL
jgi:hypothetical protein